MSEQPVADTPHPGPNDRYVVARAKDIPEGSRLLVTVEGREIGIFNIGGQLHAILNRCPHRGGALCQGDVLGLVSSTEPGDVRLEAGHKFIVCPWHGWEFDVETGKSWYQIERGQSRGFRNARPVRVDVTRGAELSDEVAAHSAETASDRAFVDPNTHRRQGPYSAELYPVERDDDYVVLSLRRISALSGPSDCPPPQHERRDRQAAQDAASPHRS